MKRSERDEWVRALRGELGDYLQGRSVLRSKDDRFCCLGVKCDLDVRAEHRHNIWSRPTVDGDTHGVTYYWQDGKLREEGERSGMPTDGILDAWGLTYTQSRALATMNDQGVSFAEIADWIEENVSVED